MNILIPKGEVSFHSFSQWVLQRVEIASAIVKGITSLTDAHRNMILCVSGFLCCFLLLWDS